MFFLILIENVGYLYTIILVLSFKEIMMLLEKIQSDYKEAMKNREMTKKNILNYVLAQIKQKKIDTQQELTDDDIIGLLRKEIKAINETISFLEKSNKPEELQEEKDKIAVIETYLPKMLSSEETMKLLEKIMLDSNITDLKTQRWMVMKVVKEQYKSVVDWALLNDLINQKISW